jgi:hypothetical protein
MNNVKNTKNVKNIYKSAVKEIKVENNLINDTAIKMMESKKTIEDPKLKNRRKSIYGHAALATCVMFLIGAVFLLQNRFNQSQIAKQPNSKQQAVVVNDNNSGNKKYPAQLSPKLTVTLNDGNGKLYINEIDRIVSTKLRVPEDSYSKDLSLVELTEYFGKNPVPVFPEGLKLAGNTVNVIFNADGSVFYMNGLQLYKDINDVKSPNISIQLDKGALPLVDCFYKGDNEKESIIGNTKLIIGSLRVGEDYSEQGVAGSYYDVYYAQFMYDGIGYNIKAERVNAQSFIELLEGIIK